MSRRGRPTGPVKRGPSESLMDFYLRNRANVDTSIDADVTRSCTSKAQYASDADARAHAAMNGMSGNLFTYHCRYCEFWHLTRRPTSGGDIEFIDE
ncbi:MAG: hypothetical protein NVSMB64_08720 [Candidatus Velthaea sp.]